MEVQYFSKKLCPPNLAKAQSLIDVHPYEAEHSLFGVLKTNRYIFNFRSEKDIMNVERTFDLLDRYKENFVKEDALCGKQERSMGKIQLGRLY